VGEVDDKAAAWRDGVLEYLPVRSGGFESAALGVSDPGHIVGYHLVPYPYSGFRLSPDGTYEELAPGIGGYLLVLNGVDRFGRAVGTELEETTSFAVAWLPGQDGPVQLASYEDEQAWLGVWPSSASDINDEGVVVGAISDPETRNSTAVMWQLPS